MAHRCLRVSRTCITLGLFLMVVCFARPSAAAWIDPLTPEERQGRNVYHYGEAGSTDHVGVNLQGVEGALPPTLFRCAGCHGPRGEGTQEGGLRVPPLTPSVLRHAREGPSVGRSRLGYTDAALANAITQGLDPSGHALHPSMPRYHLTSDQVAKVIAYLNRIGEESDIDPGVSADAVTIGAALPLTGPLAQIGQDVAATLRGAVRRLNQQGGIYGRYIELIVEDSRGEPGQTALAVSRLVEIHQVFALVGSFEPAGEGRTRERLAQSHVPWIFPLTPSPQLSDPPNSSIFYALPGFDLQFRSLVDFFVSRTIPLTGTSHPRLALVHRNGPSNAEALRGALEQVRRHGLNLAVNYEYSVGRLAVLALVAQLEQQGVDAVLFMGDGEDLVSVAQELDRRGMSPIVLSAIGMVGAQARAVPSGLHSRIFLAAPIDLPTEREVASLRALSEQASLSSIGFARLAQGAVSLLAEALKQAGRSLSRQAVVHALEGCREQDTGAGFSVTFGEHHRLGRVASKVVGLMPDPPYVSPVSGWMVPEGEP